MTSVELQLCGSLLTQLGGEVREHLDMLRSDVDHLLGTGWQGHATDGVAQGWQRWRAGADEMIDSPENMAELLGVTGRARDIIIDAEATDLSREQALAGINRFLGNKKGSYDSITIWLKDSTRLTWP